MFKEETSNRLPILFVTTPGADPSAELDDFAKTYGGEEAPSMNFHQLAMGGGQNDDAIRLLHEAARSGDWICLKNLHLVISWVPLLEKELKNLVPHENFRCWLTTEAHTKFPTILLETSLKVTYEAPPGVKKNMLRTLESWNPSWFGQGNELRSRVIFLCAHFHAIMQERRTYIPQGWTKFYEFSQSDLQSACETVSLLVKAGESTPGGGIDWVTLVGVLEQAVYGSRVDNDFDSRLVREYLAMFFKSETLEAGRRKGVEIPAFDLPSSTNMLDFKARVDQLADIDNPASFGMAPNADRSLQRINSTKAIGSLRQLAQNDMFESSQADIKLWKTQLAPLFTIWENVTRGQLSKLRGVEVRQVNVEDSPTMAFVLMDAAEASRLGELVGNALSLLQRVVNGSALSTPDLQVQAKALSRGEVPDAWAWSSAPEEPSLYLQGLARRIVALKGDWVRRVQARDVTGQPVTLSDFLRPDVFLNALRQETARRLAVSIDNLHLVSTFEPHLLRSDLAPLPITVQELILEGCAFDESKRILVEGQRNSPLVSVLPPLTIAWVSKVAHPERTTSSSRAAGTISLPEAQRHDIERY